MGSFGISEGNITGRKQTNKQKQTQNTRLTVTVSEEVAQRLTSATSEQGLDREARPAQSMLRVRTRPECPEDNLRELMWDSNPNCGIARERKKKRTSPWTSLTWPSHRTKDWMNTKGELAGCIQTCPPARGREAGMQQPEPEGKGQSWPQILHLPPNCEQAPSC